MSHIGQLRLGLADNEILDYQYLRALCYQQYAGASVGEVLQAAHEIRAMGSTRDAWIGVWTKFGERLAAYASGAERSGLTKTARDSYLRAYNYLRAGEFYFDRDRPIEHLALYQRSVECFDKAMSLMPFDVGNVEIPYEAGVVLPGYFFRASEQGVPGPTVIVCGGGDSYGEESYFTAGVAQALERNLNVVVFHGPGQRGVLLEHPEVVFRPDAETPISAVITYTASRPDVDPGRIALYGYSFGGYLAPRAAAFDHRVKALVANGPLPVPREAVLGGLVSQLPGPLQSPIERWVAHAGTRSFDLVEHLAKRQWPVAATIEVYMLWVTGLKSLAEWMDRIKEFHLTPDMIEAIDCPTLCLSAEGEGAESMRQARDFYETLTCSKDFMTLSADYGADNHIGLDNISYTSGVVYDWLQKTLA
jgi:alpha-beta hydrolase superfamily lysophospholipase